MKNVGPQAHQSVLHRSSISCPPEPAGVPAKLVTGKTEANKAMPAFAISVVRNNVKSTHRSQLVVQIFSLLKDGEIVLLHVDIYKKLH